MDKFTEERLRHLAQPNPHSLLSSDIRELLAERDAYKSLLDRLIDIEGPQPGDVQWFKDVQATLAGSTGDAATEQK